MAAIAALVAIAASWLILHGRGLLKSSGRGKFIWLLGIILIPLRTIWTFAILPDIDVGFSGDNTRIRLIRCCAESIFTGKNGVLYGTGHHKQQMMELCSDTKIGNIWANPPESSGHSHNTYAHLTGLHGLQGVVAILIISRGMLNHWHVKNNIFSSRELLCETIIFAVGRSFPLFQFHNFNYVFMRYHPYLQSHQTVIYRLITFSLSGANDRNTTLQAILIALCRRQA